MILLFFRSKMFFLQVKKYYLETPTEKEQEA